MRLIRRRAGRHVAPPWLRNARRALRRILWLAIIAVGLMWTVRTFVIGHYAVTTYGDGLETGDRILVDRRAYGWQTAAGSLVGYHCLGERMPAMNDLIVYTDTLGRPQTGRVNALPGDTIYLPHYGILPPRVLRAGETLVAREQVVGRVWAVTFSIIPDAPFYRCLDPRRFFVRIR